MILAADWSIAGGYWIVFHCLSINGNVRIRINVSYPHSQIEAPTLNVISHSQIEAPTLNVLSHSQIEAPSQCYIPLRHGLTSSLQVTASFFYITRHTKRIKKKIRNKKKKIKIKKIKKKFFLLLKKIQNFFGKKKFKFFSKKNIFFKEFLFEN